VPRIRSDASRDEKTEEVLEVAVRQLRSGGYEALSVAAIARELGIAQNAVYWYFPSKDALFVAALERLLADVMARKPKRDVGDLDRIIWFADQFAPLSALRGAMRRRAQAAPVVADFVAGLDDLLSRMLSHALASHVPAKELPRAVETIRATVEGTFVQGLGRRERQRVLRYLLERISSPSHEPG
jgi:AcrR family transcriptional regulator